MGAIDVFFNQDKTDTCFVTEQHYATAKALLIILSLPLHSFNYPQRHSTKRALCACRESSAFLSNSRESILLIKVFPDSPQVTPDSTALLSLYMKKVLLD